MQVTAFDESTAAELARMPGFSTANIALSTVHPLNAALDARRESVLVLPGLSNDEALFVHLTFPEKPQPVVQQQPAKPIAYRDHSQPEVIATAAKENTPSDEPPPQAAPKRTNEPSFPSAGFLGLEGEAVYLDELPPEKKWWQKIFGK